MRKFVTNFKLLIVLCLLFLGTISGHTQEVVNPSDDPNYDIEKAALIGEGFMPENDIDDQRTAADFGIAGEDYTMLSGGCFIPVDGSYTAVPRNDDGSYGPVYLPFTFSLYGNSYNQIYINTNGNISFTGPVYAYSASGFPSGTPMVAPFWGDVDTRCGGGAIYFKVNPTNVIVTWNGVGYYSCTYSRLNTFQAIIGTYADELTGVGQNVALNYADMQWTTGNASGGYGGFGGVPATVGVNEGGYSNYIQIGRFNQNNSNYDGPGGSYDGVNYLDYQCVGFNVSSAGNIPPSFTSLPSNNTIDLSCGEVANYSITAIAPEVNQNVSISANTGGLCNTTATVSGSTVNLSITADNCNEGSNVITLTAIDNGNPSESSTVEITVNVTNCCVPTSVVCPANVSVENDEGECGAFVTYASASVSGSEPTVTYSHPSGSFFPVGTTEVMVTADNACGSASCSFTVEVIDASSPVLSFPSAYAVSSDAGLCGASVAFEATATDNCSAAITYSHAPGSFFPVGSTTVTATAADPSGNYSSASTVVTVIDEEAPVAACKDVTVTLVGGEAFVTPDMIDDGSYDACGLASVDLDVTSFDCSNIGSNPVVLTVTDIHGNTSTCAASVEVVGEVPSCSIDVALENDTYTGGDGFTLFLGYGPQSLIATVTADGGAPFTYSWTGGAGYLSSTTSESPVFTPTEDGVYDLVCEVTNAYGCTTTCEISICVMDIRAGGNGNNQKVYLCHVPNGNQNKAKTLKVSVNAVPGHLSNHEGDRLGRCDQECGNFKVDYVDADFDSDHDPVLSVYPNPSMSTFNVTLDSHSDDLVNMEVYDHLGKRVLTFENFYANDIIEFGDDLAPGLYYIQVRQGDYNQSQKVLKAE